MKKNSSTHKFIINGTEYSVKLKDVRYFPEMSDETNAFAAILTISFDGNSVELPCRNDGNGGMTDVNAYDYQSRAVANTFKEYLKTVPNTQFIDYMAVLGVKMKKDSPMYYMSLDSLVDQLVDECIY